MKHLFRFEDGVARAESFALCALVLAMVGLSFAQIVLRLVFHSGIMWAEPFLRYMVLWAGFIGAGLAARHARHFCLDLAAKFLHGAVGLSARIVAAVFSSAVCILLINAAWKYFKDERANGISAFSIASYNVPGFWAEMIIPVGVGLIMFHMLIGLFRGEESA